MPLLLVASTLLVCLAYLQFIWPGSLTSSAAPLSWRGDTLNLTQGEGHPVSVSRSLAIDTLTGNGVAVAAVGTKIFSASDYSRVSWNISGNQPGLTMAFLWRTAENPSRFF